MSAPDPSKLDGNQVLQASFDESTGRLRTDSLATVVNADIDVSLQAFEDNVAIATPDGKFLEIETDGSINVNSVNGALEATQQQVVSELQSLNTSTANIESDIDVALSTRATEATQILNNTELQNANTNLEFNNALYSRILPLLANATFLKFANLDRIDQSFLGNTVTLSYKEDQDEIAKVFIEFNNAYDWNLSIERYILAEAPTPQLLDDNDEPLFLD